MSSNADLAKRAVVDSENEPWISSPLAGVDRRILERDGDEMARRATTVVRYAAGSHFHNHVHDLGEEFLVLEGVFSDETGDFHAGMYVRNPPGSEHSPHSRKGCTIFVKLRQFDPDDLDSVRIDTNTAAWPPEPVEGRRVLPLHVHGRERVSLQRWQPGTAFPNHSHPGGEEIFVLEGVFEDERGSHPKGSWLRIPSGEAHRSSSRDGCTIYVKSGHLPAGGEGR